MSEDNAKRCVIYSRVSTTEQDTENQVVQLREYASRQVPAWVVVDDVRDVCSGGKADKPGLVRVMDMARKKKVDVVLFWSLDRFSREGTRRAVERLHALDDCGAEWESYSESWLTSMGPFRDVVIAIMTTLALQERLRISERTKAGLATARRNGSRLGRPVTDAAVLARACALRAAGKTFGEIAVEMGVSRSRAFQMAGGAKHNKSITSG